MSTHSSGIQFEITIYLEHEEAKTAVEELNNNLEPNRKRKTPQTKEFVEGVSEAIFPHKKSVEK